MVEINLGIFLSALGTVFGAIPALLIRNVSHRVKDNLLAYSAGIMVAASAYALIPSTLKLSNMFVLTFGILVGTAVLTLLEIFLPHQDAGHGADSSSHIRPLLIIAAMAIHNIPEGISVGVSYASQFSELGSLVSFSIGLQNIPEGFLVCLFLVTNKIPRLQAFLYTAFTGVIELVSSLIGLQLSDAFFGIVPYGLAFAAGAMLFVVYKELIPESHGDGNERSATFSFVIGLISMIYLTNLSL
ncbi:ZIP family metal transporter [Fictibacillus sp. NE201]|uniref:ZIP family metal transporter n=1 Tax=Fictibacillus fluitans TaxID=3058422 RepID=A0ABT8HWD0_9BACL|nr:ZIP family metal transporter [Fictibacillus sp. NE201]MDN4525051.1 ZIP family metal transporter [Fictibacillus sp. NE201]